MAVEMKRRILTIALLSGLLIATTSCKTKEVPGRVRAPRHCNTCTKWSYIPQQADELELLHHAES